MSGDETLRALNKDADGSEGGMIDRIRSRLARKGEVAARRADPGGALLA